MISDTESSADRQSKLVVGGVSKSYGALKALDRLDMTAAAGEFVALLGPNGAGKSTLFQLLTGLYTPDSGVIEFAGINLSENASRALASMGVVFQQSTLDLDLTVERNLLFHCDLHGVSEAREKISAALAQVGLTDVRHYACRTLSGGNRRKVELVRALLHNPSLLLMDEATVGLDPGSRQSLLEQVRQLCQSQGLCVLWATHLVDEADDADRVYILEKGQCLASGTPAEVADSAGCPTLLDAFLALTKQGAKDVETHVN